MALELTLQGHTDRMAPVCSLSDGRLASGSADTTVRVWDVLTYSCVLKLEVHTASVMSVCSLSDGRLASGSDDKTVRVWDLKSGMCLQSGVGPSYLLPRQPLGCAVAVPCVEPFVCRADTPLRYSIISPDGTRWIGVFGSSVVFASTTRPMVTEDMREQLLDGQQIFLRSQQSFLLNRLAE